MPRIHKPDWPKKNETLFNARTLTQEKLDEANKEWGLKGNLVFKVEKNASEPFVTWAQGKLRAGETGLTPFDDLGELSSDVIKCRDSTIDKCGIDPSCTTWRSNDTIFVGDFHELRELVRGADKGVDFNELLGLTGVGKDAMIVVLRVKDLLNVRVPCANGPSVICPNRCQYDQEDLPLKFCEDNEAPVSKVSKKVTDNYPVVGNIAANMNLCNSDGAPFLGTGKTSGGVREFILHAGLNTEVEVIYVIRLKDALELIIKDKLTGSGKRRKKTRRRPKKRRMTKRRKYKKKRNTKRKSKINKFLNK